MWCSNCGQDVPGITPADSSRTTLACARCGDALVRWSNAWEEDAGDIELASLSSSGGGGTERREAPTIDWDEWCLDESLDLRGPRDRVEHLPALEPESAAHHRRIALHGAHAAHVSGGCGQRSRRRRPSSLLTWLLLILGIATFVCGGILVGWSFVGNRSELWTIGAPLGLAGQALILVGLVLQMDLVSRHGRDTSETLSGIDQQISELKRTTTLLAAAGTPSQTFYRHVAEGASPQLLIADLKGQLDLLTARVSHAGDS